MALAELSAALSSLKAASDIAKGIKSLKTEVAINEKASELLDVIIDVKMNLIELQNHYDALQVEKKLSKQPFYHSTIGKSLKRSIF